MILLEAAECNKRHSHSSWPAESTNAAAGLGRLSDMGVRKKGIGERKGEKEERGAVKCRVLVLLALLSFFRALDVGLLALLCCSLAPLGLGLALAPLALAPSPSLLPPLFQHELGKGLLRRCLCRCQSAHKRTLSRGIPGTNNSSTSSSFNPI